MDDYPGNSRESDTPKVNYVRNTAAETPSADGPEETIKPIVTGKVVRKPQSLGRKFNKAFFGMGFRETVDDVLWNVIIPDARHMAEDIITGAVRRAIWGESRPTRGSDLYGRATNFIASRHTNYARQYQVPSRPVQADPPPREIGRQERKYHNFDELVIPTRHDAERVLENMYLVLDSYQRVTVAAFYSMLDISPDQTDNTWGWTDLMSSEVRRHSSGGYYIRLPRPSPLNRG